MAQLAVALVPLLVLLLVLLGLHVALLHAELLAERRAHQVATWRCRQLEQEASRPPGPYRARPRGEAPYPYEVRPLSGRGWIAWGSTAPRRSAVGHTPIKALEQLLDLEAAARRPS